MRIPYKSIFKEGISTEDREFLETKFDDMDIIDLVFGDTGLETILKFLRKGKKIKIETWETEDMSISMKASQMKAKGWKMILDEVNGDSSLAVFTK